jgi:UDP:flavonoid glycosyltransferase YjiC (YdhE family)
VNILLAPVGSHGDVHPFLGIGETLLRRGRRVTMFTNGLFEPLARKVGLDFVEVGTAEEFKKTISDRDIWHPSRGWKRIFASIVNELLPRQYDALQSRVIPGETVIVAATLAFGARVLQDKTGEPTATVHLQPSIIRSAYEPPRLPAAPPLGWAPPFFMRFVFNFVDRFVLDPVIAPPLNAFRAEKGLPPVKYIVRDWWHSPDLAIGLFPGWFSKPQPDWPPQMRLTGFPLFDEKGIEPLSAELKSFLDAGDAPIAFTPGSAMFHGREFFEAAVDACTIVNRRGILLTRHRENLPASLPPGVIHIPYAPFSELLPRCAALVHHGGIGTTAQGMAAGIPQLIQPMSHDQPDNAERLKKLGVGEGISVKRFRGPEVARKLRMLIGDTNVAARCKEVAARFVGDRPLDTTCDLIENVTRSPASVRGDRLHQP